MRTFNATIAITHNLTFEGVRIDNEQELRQLISDTVERCFRDYESALKPNLQEGEDVWEDDCSHEVTSITLISEDDDHEEI